MLVASSVDEPHSVLGLLTAEQVHPVYNDSGSGAHGAISIFRPKVPLDYFFLGDLAMPYYGEPALMPIVCTPLREPGDVPILREAVGLEKIWDDSGSGGDYSGSFWEPTAPDGYVAMGVLGSSSHDAPDTTYFRCIRRDFVTGARLGDVLWTDDGSGAKMSVGLYRIVPRPDRNSMVRGLSVNTFWATSSYKSKNEPVSGLLAGSFE